jgi:hypothetical protein
LVEAAYDTGYEHVIEEIRARARVIEGTGQIAPAKFHEFVWRWFIDGPPREKPGPKPYDNLARDQLLSALVRIVHEEFGFPATRGEASKQTGSTVSACQIVAEETGVGEDAVVTVWKNSAAKRRMDDRGQ